MDALLFQTIALLFAIVAVLIAIWYGVTRWIGRVRHSSTHALKISVYQRIPLGTKREIMILEIEGIVFVLGVTEQNITVLHRFEASELAEKTQGEQKELPDLSIKSFLKTLYPSATSTR